MNHTSGYLAYRVAHAARLVGLSDKEIRREIERGLLASVRVGRVRLIEDSALRAWLLSKREAE